MPEISKIASTVLRDNGGRYLMVQEKKVLFAGLWGFPGGHEDEEDETSGDAAIRETEEETGLTVELIYQKPIYEERDLSKKIIYRAFAARIISGNLNIDKDELLDAQWLPRTAIEEMNTQGQLRDPWVMRAIIAAENYAHSGH